jgi:hypothetical protein
MKPTRQPGEKTNKLLKTKLSLHVVWTWKNKNLIYFIYQQRKYSRKTRNKIIKRTLQDLCIHNTIWKWKFHEKMYFVDIFFCLFCNFHGSKPTRTRTENREKQRNGLSTFFATWIVFSNICDLSPKMVNYNIMRNLYCIIKTWQDSLLTLYSKPNRTVILICIAFEFMP